MSLHSKEEAMRKQIILVAFIASLIGIDAAQAQEPRNFSLLAMQTVQLPGTAYSFVFNSPELQIGEARDIAKLSMAISSWLSANFGLPKTHQMPHVGYIATSEMAETATYHSRTQTIYLPVGWNGSTPTEMAAFVRAMVHHMQSEVGTAYESSPAQLAKAVQGRWLAMFNIEGQQVNATTASDVASNPGCIFRQSRVEN
jgi:Domain of unknown function (DUF6647)